MDMKIAPARLSGSLAAPPSKSHAHRLMTAMFLAGREIPEAMCTSDDLTATRRCLCALRSGEALDCGESGTTLRFLLPVAAALGVKVRFEGHGRLPERPMSELVRALRENGAVISSDTLPISLSGKLHAGTFCVPGNISSQFISGLLFALPLLGGDSEIVISGKRESAGYIEMTLDVLRAFSIDINRTENGFTIKGNQQYTAPADCTVQGDWSNAAFFLCMSALGSNIKITGLDMSCSQSDRAVTDILKKFGAEVTDADGTVTVCGGKLHGQRIDISPCPDLFPALAVTACAAEGDTVFFNAGRLRIKESDRIAAVEAMIKSLGGSAESTRDTLTVHGGGLQGGEVDSFNDHRIVMAAATAACVCKEPIMIRGAQAVNKSYPTFFKDYTELGGKSDVI